MRLNLIAGHVPGKELIIADTLSRSPLQHNKAEDAGHVEDVQLHVHYIQLCWPVSQPKLLSMKSAPATDPVLQMVSQYILQQWPQSETSVPSEVKPYLQVKGQL